MALNPIRTFERNAAALAHFLICRVQGEQWTYGARGVALLVLVMPGPVFAMMRKTINTRTEERTGPVEIARQATNKGAYVDTAGTWVNGIATLTIGAHTILVGDTVTVAGVNPAGFNGTFTVTAITGTTFSYALLTNPGAWVSAGSEQSATQFPPLSGVIEDDTLTDPLGNVFAVRKIELDDLGAIYTFTAVQSTTKQVGMIGD